MKREHARGGCEYKLEASAKRKVVKSESFTDRSGDDAHSTTTGSATERTSKAIALGLELCVHPFFFSSIAT